LYAHDGKLKYCFNFFGIEHYITEANKPIPAGKHQVRMEFAYDGGGLAKGGDVTLYYDGKQVGKGRVDQTIPMGYSAERPATSAPTPDRPPRRTTALPATASPVRSIGCKSMSVRTATPT
jgi:hypothetical protein